MDTELDRMNRRNAKMEELRQVKTMVSDFGTEIAGIKHDHAALQRWVALGILAGHVAGMAEAQPGHYRIATSGTKEGGADIGAEIANL